MEVSVATKSSPMKSLDQITVQVRFSTRRLHVHTSISVGTRVLDQRQEGFLTSFKVPQSPDLQGVAGNGDVLQGVQGCTGVPERVEVSKGVRMALVTES